MNLEIKDYMYLYPKDTVEKQKILDALSANMTYNNPVYQKNLELGLKVFGIPRHIKTYKTQGNAIVIPRGAFRILKILAGRGVDVDEVVDNRSVGLDVSIKCNFEPRDHIQKAAIDTYMNETNKCGILTLPCGLADVARPTINQVHLQM